MRRLVLVSMTSALVLALVPASALARARDDHPNHKRHHHARVHHRAHVRHQRFGHVASPAGAAGTVDSFVSGRLTIKLNDGSAVSGAVTSETELECEAAEPMDSSAIHVDGDRGDHHGGGGDGRGSGRDDLGDRDDRACTTSELTPGTLVRRADLEISRAGSAWDRVNLILQRP